MTRIADDFAAINAAMKRLAEPRYTAEDRSIFGNAGCRLRPASKELKEALDPRNVKYVPVQWGSLKVVL